MARHPWRKTAILYLIIMSQLSCFYLWYHSQWRHKNSCFIYCILHQYSVVLTYMCKTTSTSIENISGLIAPFCFQSADFSTTHVTLYMRLPNQLFYFISIISQLIFSYLCMGLTRQAHKLRKWPMTGAILFFISCTNISDVTLTYDITNQLFWLAPFYF